MISDKRLLSIIVCAYNERRTILAAIDQARLLDLGPDWDQEIIVVDNFSTDGTRELLASVDLPKVRAILHPRNLGKSASILTAIDHARGDFIAIFDADLEYEARDLARMIDAINQEDTVAVFGSRTLGGRKIYEYAENYWGVRLLTWLANLFFGGRLTDIAVGMKLARLDVVRSLNLSARDFDFDFELPCKLLRLGYEIKEVPIAYRPRTAEQGKGLVGWRAMRTGLRWLLILLKTRLGAPAGEPGGTR
ncbi:MAG: glycosyltransferase family 2 protein [Anaerolineae bacterium]|jgi:glycosyltransferase involved in cell wall biosynthesis